jgi:hypothetical protein
MWQSSLSGVQQHSTLYWLGRKCRPSSQAAVYGRGNPGSLRMFELNWGELKPIQGPPIVASLQQLRNKILSVCRWNRIWLSVESRDLQVQIRTYGVLYTLPPGTSLRFWHEWTWASSFSRIVADWSLAFRTVGLKNWRDAPLAWWLRACGRAQLGSMTCLSSRRRLRAPARCLRKR